MKGFTLIELMVAVVAASALTMSAWLLYSRYHQATQLIQKTYLQNVEVNIRLIKNAMPYAIRGIADEKRNPGLRPGR